MLLFWSLNFWNNKIDIPNQKYVIGNPHYHKKLSEYNNFHKEKSAYKILIVSQGTLTEIFVKLAVNLSSILPAEYSIIFKLHPGEVSFIDRYSQLYTCKNIDVKTFGDIYEYITECDYIVGCYSTTLYEALCI